MALGKTVRELAGSIDSEELSEWMAFDAFQPLPDPHYGAASINATLCNLLTTKGPRKAAADFYPARRRLDQVEEQSPGEIIGIFEGIARNMRARGA